MDTVDVILNRRSVREFSSRKIEEDTLHDILAAGMSGPSCADTRDWSFLIIRDKKTLAAMAEANGPYASPLADADVGVLICGDLERSYPDARDYWVVDGSIAGQNMILAASSMGVGTVWLGTWPEMDRVERQRALFGLPKHIVPHSIIAFGYPAHEDLSGYHMDYEDSRVHFEKW